MYAFGERIKKLRELNGLTQKQVAEMLGVSKAAVSSYESGINTPPAQKLHRLAAILHTNPAYLIGRDEARTLTLDITELTESQEATVRRIIVEFTKANKAANGGSL